ncbi:MAG TPA: BadF/BadG/BcrA/BcrD ATPase family protein [Microbacteriaceae bacterium]
MRKQLAIDAGGTTTRAVVLDSRGHPLGYGRAGSGNPTASGIAGAAAAVLTAAQRALRSDATPTDPTSSALIALAGFESERFHDAVTELIAEIGFQGGVVIESDLAGMFFSGTPREHGYGLIAGTGAVAARIEHGKLERVAGGAGWLLGDSGSGFWIGHRVARAVVAALDGQAPPTALTALVLQSLELNAHEAAASERRTIQGRPRILTELIDTLYALPPVQLARFAPFAFQVKTDAVARDILTGAASALARLLSTVHDPRREGELVVGGSVLAAGLRDAPELFAPRLAEVAPESRVRRVPDGLVGAAVMALRRAGTTVDDALFARLGTDIARSAASYSKHAEELGESGAEAGTPAAAAQEPAPS